MNCLIPEFDLTHGSADCALYSKVYVLHANEKLESRCAINGVLTSCPLLAALYNKTACRFHSQNGCAARFRIQEENRNECTLESSVRIPSQSSNEFQCRSVSVCYV